MQIQPGDKIRHAYGIQGPHGFQVIVTDRPAMRVRRVTPEGRIHTDCGGIYSGACCVKVPEDSL